MKEIRDRTGNNENNLIAKERITVKITTPKGDLVTHDMIAENTFDEVKEKHSGAVNVQKHLIKLSYQGAEVTDDSNLGGMKLKVGSNEVSLQAKERIFANVQTPKGKIIQHELETTDDI